MLCMQEELQAALGSSPTARGPVEWASQLPVCSRWTPWSHRLKVLLSNKQDYRLDFPPRHCGRSGSKAVKLFVFLTEADLHPRLSDRTVTGLALSTLKSACLSAGMLHSSQESLPALLGRGAGRPSPQWAGLCHGSLAGAELSGWEGWGAPLCPGSALVPWPVCRTPHAQCALPASFWLEHSWTSQPPGVLASPSGQMGLEGPLRSGRGCDSAPRLGAGKSGSWASKTPHLRIQIRQICTPQSDPHSWGPPGSSCPTGGAEELEARGALSPWGCASLGEGPAASRGCLLTGAAVSRGPRGRAAAASAQCSGGSVVLALEWLSAALLGSRAKSGTTLSPSW